jgi:hypothetical protein
MKTVAEFKRKAEVGSKWHCTFHRSRNFNKDTKEVTYTDEDRGIREVSKQCTVHIAFKTTHKDGKVVDSYLPYPKAKDVKFISEDVMQVYEEGVLLMTYTFVTPDSPVFQQPRISAEHANAQERSIHNQGGQNYAWGG